MKKIASLQLVGDGFGMMYFRDLYQLPNGKRLSIPRSVLIDVEKAKGKTLRQLFQENKTK